MAWQRQLQNVPKTAVELLKYLDLSTKISPSTLNLQTEFALRLPASYLDKIQPADPQDPLLLQILPQAQEQTITAGFNTDPVADKAAQKNPALLHKYQGRALLLLTGNCVIHCRYCFRQHYAYQQLNKNNINAAIQHIRTDSSLTEIILSGGDPLSLSNRRLAYYLEQLAAIPHLRRIRIHSRLPVVLPERIDTGLLHLLKQNSLAISLVIHCNHAQEIDKKTQTALYRLRQAGVWLFNQAVLLRGINADSRSQIALCERLADCQVVPYYLHLLDKVQGAAHFDITEQQARDLMQILQQQLPGYLVPNLVREVAGCAYKQRIA